MNQVIAALLISITMFSCCVGLSMTIIYKACMDNGYEFYQHGAFKFGCQDQEAANKLKEPR